MRVPEALARARSGGLVEGRSARSLPKLLHPKAVQAMRDEHSIDLKGHRPKHPSTFVTGPGGRQVLLEDPSGHVIAPFEAAGD